MNPILREFYDKYTIDQLNLKNHFAQLIHSANMLEDENSRNILFCRLIGNSYAGFYARFTFDEILMLIDVADDYHIDISKYILQKYIDINLLKHLLDSGRFANNINDVANRFIDSYKQERLALCLDYGADLNKTLEYAVNKFYAFYNDNESIEIFIDFFLKKIINHHTNNYDTEILSKFLQLCIERISIPVDSIKILVELGADPHFDDDGNIIYAVGNSNCDRETIEYLVYECNLNINTSDSDALQVAITDKKKDMAILLLDMGIVIKDNCIRASIDAGTEYINLLIKYGVEPDRIAEVYFRISLNYVPVAKLLLEHGVDFNSVVSNIPEKKN